MEIILSKQCEYLTGSLGRGFGYHIQRRTENDGTIRFWGVRQSKGAVPPDGHWKFILSCVNLAQSKLHITDIRVAYQEVWNALNEACICVSILGVDPPKFYNAQDILNLKNMYNL